MLRLFALTLALGSAVGAAEDYRRTVANSTGAPELCVTWNRRDLTWHSEVAGSLRTPGDSEFVAVDAAWQTWQALSDTCSDFTFTRGARVTKPKIGKGSEDASVVVFREAACPTEAPCVADGSCAEVLGCWDHSANTIGLTTVTYSTRTGVAIDADIELNAANFLFTAVASPPCEEGREDVSCVAYDVQNTVTHEIGHVVGFDHVFDSPASTMAPTAAVGDTQKRIVDLGTATGFCGTYPRGQPPVPCDALAQLQRRIIATNVGSFGCTCANLAPATPLGALAALVLVTMLRRRAG